MEKEYEISKDSTKNEEQNAAGNSEEPRGTKESMLLLHVYSPSDWNIFLPLVLFFHYVIINIFNLWLLGVSTQQLDSEVYLFAE